MDQHRRSSVEGSIPKVYVVDQVQQFQESARQPLTSGPLKRTNISRPNHDSQGKKTKTETGITGSKKKAGGGGNIKATNSKNGNGKKSDEHASKSPTKGFLEKRKCSTLKK